MTKDRTTSTPDSDPTAEESVVVRRANRIATLFDQRFRLPGTSIRFGYDALIGLIPVVGDTLTAGVSTYLVVEAWRLRIGTLPILRMILNIGIDWLLGLIPLADVIFDVAFKANTRNATILTKALNRRKNT